MKFRLIFNGNPNWIETLKVADKDFDIESFAIVWGDDVRKKCGVSETNYLNNPFEYVDYKIIEV